MNLLSKQPLFVRAFVLAVLAGFALAAGFLAFFSSSPNALLVCVFLFVSPVFAASFLESYTREKRQRELEDALPAAIFQLASFPKGAPVEKMVESVAANCKGALGAEFAMALRQLKSGLPVGEVLAGLARRNQSRLLRHVVSLLQSSQQEGSNVGPALRQAAEDAYKLSSISREVSASLALHKYTLLLASALIVPGVLGTLISVTTPFAQGNYGGLGIGGSAQVQQGLRDAILLSSQLYLAILAVLCSLFVAFSEGNARKAALYAAFLVPCSLVVFAVVSAFVR